jgi:hypothetical protein
MIERGFGKSERAAFQDQRRAVYLVDELRSLLDDLVLHDGAPTASASDPAPARPEDEGDEGADPADDEQDVADGVDVEAGRRDVHGESQDGSDCNQDQADSDTHDNLLREPFDDPFQPRTGFRHSNG